MQLALPRSGVVENDEDGKVYGLELFLKGPVVLG